MLREKVATDVFRASGLVSSHAAIYEVYVDHGDGPTYFGVYTLVEEVDDTLIDEFSNNDGNLYKPTVLELILLTEVLQRMYLLRKQMKTLQIIVIFKIYSRLYMLVIEQLMPQLGERI